MLLSGLPSNGIFLDSPYTCTTNCIPRKIVIVAILPRKPEESIAELFYHAIENSWKLLWWQHHQCDTYLGSTCLFVLFCDTNAGYTWSGQEVGCYMVKYQNAGVHMYCESHACSYFRSRIKWPIKNKAAVWMACSTGIKKTGTDIPPYGNCHYMYAEWHYLMRYWMFHLAFVRTKFW